MVSDNLQLESDATNSGADAVQDTLSGGGSELLNPLLRGATARSAATLDACMRTAGVAFEPGSLPGVALRANTNATNTTRVTGLNGVTSMNVYFGMLLCIEPLFSPDPPTIFPVPPFCELIRIR